MDYFFQYVDFLRTARGLVLNKTLNADKRVWEMTALGERLNKIFGNGPYSAG